MSKNKNNSMESLDSDNKSNVSDILKYILDISNNNELLSDKYLNAIIDNNGNEETLNLINFEKFNKFEVIFQLTLLAIDNENKVLLNYLLNKHIEQYYPSEDIVQYIYKKDELNKKRINFIIKNENKSFRLSSSLIKELINQENETMLDEIFSNLMFFDNQFIIECCIYNKNKVPLSVSDLDSKIDKYKIFNIDHKKYYAYNIIKYMYIACENNNIKFLKFLIHNVINIEYFNLNTLCKLMEDKKLSIMNYLINYGMDVNKKESALIDIDGKNYDSNLVTPLIVACRYSKEKLVECLIEHGANVNEVMKDGNTALTVSCSYNEENKNENIIKYLIDHGADVNKKGNQYMAINGEKYSDGKYKIGVTPLIIACKYGYEMVKKYLVNHGANVNEAMEDGNTALIVACKYNEENENENIIKYLIDNGANVNEKGNQCIKINRENYYDGKYKIPLIIACRFGNENIVKYLIEHGANVNEAMDDGNTALIVACKYNEEDKNENIIKYLIDHGADVNKKGNQRIDINGEFKAMLVNPLIIACNYGNENIVKYLIDHGANVNEVMADDNTALIVACRNNNGNKNDNIIKYLIDHGADVNKKGIQYIGINGETSHRDRYKMVITPLIIACKFGNEDIIKYLIEHGANVNEIMEDGNTALTVACGYNNRNRNDNIIKYLIDNGADVDKKGEQCINIDRWEYKYMVVPPLIIACNYRYENIVKYLVDHGANVNEVMEDGNTALTFVCWLNQKNKNVNIIKYLIDHGADVNKKGITYNNLGGSYIKDMKITPLIFTCIYGNEIVAKYLIDHGANSNEVMDDGNTALIVACRYNDQNKNENIIKYLIDHGADVNKKGNQRIPINGDKYYDDKNKMGITPLIIACRYVYEAIAKYLIDHGANVNEVIDDNNTALTVACRYNYDDKNENIIKYLIDHGADVNKKVNQYITINGEKYYNDKNKIGVTPLIIACRYGYEAIAKYLVDHGANVNEVMDDGNTALTVACGYNEKNKNKNIIKYLIDHDADLNKKGKQDIEMKNYSQVKLTTPLIIACSYRNESIVKYLIDHGANINEAMDDGNTALTVACGCNEDNKNENIIKYLIDHGADINKMGNHEVTMYCSIYLRDHIIPASPLIIACKYGYESIVKYLVDHGANVNEVMEDDNTALIIASAFNDNNKNDNIIKYLIDHGADVNKKGYYLVKLGLHICVRENMITPLIIACSQGNENIIKYLIEHGANVNQSGYDHTIITSMSRNANYNITTPLTIARRYDHKNIIKYLIEHGAKK